MLLAKGAFLPATISAPSAAAGPAAPPKGGKFAAAFLHVHQTARFVPRQRGETPAESVQSRPGKIILSNAARANIVERPVGRGCRRPIAARRAQGFKTASRR